jgi:SAM-dependent methyltransferase
MDRPPTWAHADPCAAVERDQCYGEVTERGLQRVLHLLPPSCTLRPDSVVYDVGSGFGAAAAFLRAATNVDRVVGVEINACRAAVAARRARDGLTLVHGDVRRLGFEDATHVYLTSQCFSPSLLRAIFSRLAARAPRLRCIVDVGSADALVAQRIVPLAASWGAVREIAPDITATWDEHAAALYVVRGACNATCVRRARRWLEHTAAEAEASDLPGPVNPWRLASRRTSTRSTRRRPV